jgi:hypothetical protein
MLMVTGRTVSRKSTARASTVIYAPPEGRQLDVVVMGAVLLHLWIPSGH